jgi:hypothetical protein
MSEMSEISEMSELLTAIFMKNISLFVTQVPGQIASQEHY